MSRYRGGAQRLYHTQPVQYLTIKNSNLQKYISYIILNSITYINIREVPLNVCIFFNYLFLSACNNSFKLSTTFWSYPVISLYLTHNRLFPLVIISLWMHHIIERFNEIWGKCRTYVVLITELLIYDFIPVVQILISYKVKHDSESF